MYIFISSRGVPNLQFYQVVYSFILYKTDLFFYLYNKL